MYVNHQRVKVTFPETKWSNFFLKYAERPPNCSGFFQRGARILI